jgi:DNA-binding HxlR family transcriptional regulator
MTRRRSRLEPLDPEAVHYDLTAKGEELLDVLAELDEWARNWGEEPPDGTTRPSSGA